MSMLAELNKVKSSINRGVFRLDMDLIKNVASMIDCKHSAEGIFQRKHLLKHPEHGVRTFAYEIDLLNFLLEAVEKKIK